MKRPDRERRRRKRLRQPTRVEIRQAMIAAYRINQETWVENEDERTLEGLRRRKDGSPSAVRPQAVVPLPLWAVYEPLPDGGEEDDTMNRLDVYRAWLKQWKDMGLYDGGTELIVVNPPDDE